MRSPEPRVRRVRAAVTRLPPWGIVAMEAILVLLVTALAGTALRWLVRDTPVPRTQAVLLLELATAGAAALVSLLCVLISRMQGSTPLPMVAAAWGFYALVVMPLSAMHLGDSGQLTVHTALLVAGAVFLVLLALALAEARYRWLRGARALVAGVVLTAAVMVVGSALPAAAEATIASGWPNRVVLGGWVLLAAAFVVRGVRIGEPVWWRLGLGVGVVAAAHLQAVVTGGVLNVPDVGFLLLRLVGFLVLFTGIGLRARQIGAELRAWRDEESERHAAAERERHERDHEMRNVLTNLAALPQLLDPSSSQAVAAQLQVAGFIDLELQRLRALLDPGPVNDPDTCTVDRMLTRLVTLCRAKGEEITIDCTLGIAVGMPAATLAQVLTNLLANCARHAAGAPVHIEVRREGSACRIDVTDGGPGVAADAVPGPTAGSGLGLALSRQLVADRGGELRLLPATRYASGCTARLELPVAAARAHVVGVPAADQGKQAAG